MFSVTTVGSEPIEAGVIPLRFNASMNRATGIDQAEIPLTPAVSASVREVLKPVGEHLRRMRKRVDIDHQRSIKGYFAPVTFFRRHPRKEVIQVICGRHDGIGHFEVLEQSGHYTGDGRGHRRVESGQIHYESAALARIVDEIHQT